jgi:CDP-4-dehydro-6-deoxyglucose reductase
LLSWKELAPEVHHFEFEVPGVRQFHFTPGQFISVKEMVDGKEITRAYSIASPRDGNKFALCLNRVPEGLVSPLLFSLKVGEEIEVHEPLGYFTLRHPGRRIVFVATGTGIFGVRYERGLLYREELEQLEREHPTFHFMPTVTRPTESWRGRSGRVHAHIDEALALHTSEEMANVDVYICGLKEMVDEVRRDLKTRGFDRKQIIYEKYD